MRPKIVIVTLVVALGLIGVMVVFRGVLGGDRNGGTGLTAQMKDGAAAPGEAQTDPALNAAPAASAEARAGQIQTEVDQINELLAGGLNPSTTSMLLAKLSHPEAEVRKAAVDALVQLNDTNAIPGLEQAATAAQEPHEKVALMDAVAYLKLPDVTANTEGRPLADAADAAAVEAALKKAAANHRPQSGKKGRRAAIQRSQPGNSDQTQPAPTQENPQAQ